MGYYSNYSIIVMESPSNEESKEIINEIEKESGYHFEDKSGDSARSSDVKWYDYFDDIQRVAKRHPDAIIQVTREGEDREDTEIIRFKGDNHETLENEEIYPPFARILTGNEIKSHENVSYFKDILKKLKEQADGVLNGIFETRNIDSINMKEYAMEGVTDYCGIIRDNHDYEDDYPTNFIVKSIEKTKDGLKVNLDSEFNDCDAAIGFKSLQIEEMMIIIETVGEILEYCDENNKPIVAIGDILESDEC